MATLTLEDKTRNGLLKKYHTLCGQLGLSDDTRRAMLYRSYNAISSTDLSAQQLIDICGLMERELNPELAELDKWRKRLIKSIDAFLELVGKQKNIAIIKAIGCRAAKRENFNDIPKEQLRSLYSAFTRAQKDQRSVNDLIVELL